MLKFSASLRYGLRAIIYLANCQKPVSINKINRDEYIPAPFLEKIMLKLKNAQIIASKQGKNGGFYLKKPIAKINLAEIISALDKNKIPCTSTCLKKNCQTKDIWQIINQHFEKSLKQVRLSQIICSSKNLKRSAIK